MAITSKMKQSKYAVLTRILIDFLSVHGQIEKQVLVRLKSFLSACAENVIIFQSNSLSAHLFRTKNTFSYSDGVF